MNENEREGEGDNEITPPDPYPSGALSFGDSFIMAQTHRSAFEAWVGVGFTQPQAMQLLITFITMGSHAE